jgi:hypothetical protein
MVGLVSTALPEDRFLMAEWSEQWMLYDYAQSGWKLLDEKERYRPGPRTPVVEVVPKQEAEQKIEEAARKLNGELVDALDGRRDAEQRAQEADDERDQALKQGAAEERERLREKLKRLLDRAPSARLAVLSQYPSDEGRVYALDPDDLLSAIDQVDSAPSLMSPQTQLEEPDQEDSSGR